MQKADHESDNDFSLVETILWEHCCGYWLLPEHLGRLKGSSGYFSRRYDENRLRQRLEGITKDLPPRPHLVRVEIGPDGEMRLSVEPSSEDRSPVRATLAGGAVDPGDPFLYHHTTRRRLYDEAAATAAGFDEVLLWNDRGEITESCTANILCELDGRYYTPPVSCGLLPGTYRASLLRERDYIERAITIDELAEFNKVYLINSAVGWREVINWGGGRRGD